MATAIFGIRISSLYLSIFRYDAKDSVLVKAIDTSLEVFVFLQNVFQQDSNTKQAKLIETYPLATIVSHGDEGLTADHIPLFIEKNDQIDTIGQSLSGSLLQGHIAKANPCLLYTSPSPRD